jgi:DNA-binding beta-propeller fold protein YncE
LTKEWQVKAKKLPLAVPVITFLAIVAVIVGLLFQLGIIGNEATKIAAETVSAPTATTVAATATTVRATAILTATVSSIGVVEASVKIPAEEPQGILYAAGSLWVVCVGDKLMVRIDPKSNQVLATIALPDFPSGGIATDDAVWIGTRGGTVLHIDPATNKVVGTFPIERGEQSIALAGGSLWIANGVTSSVGSVRRVDLVSNNLLDNIPMHEPSLKDKSKLDWPATVGSKDMIWVADGRQQSIVGIDPKTSAVVETIPVGVSGDGLSLLGNSLWINASEENKVLRLDLATKKIVASFDANYPVNTLATEDAVWVSLPYDGKLMRIDPKTNRVLGTVTTYGSPQGAIAAEGAIWLADGRGSRVVKIIPGP